MNETHNIDKLLGFALILILTALIVILSNLLPAPTEEEKREYKRENPDNIEVLTVDGDTVVIDGYYGPDGGRILRLKK